MPIAEIKHFHLFCGLGGGAKGFNQGEARVGNLQARFRCIGGVDVDPAAIADFGRLAGVPGTCLDMFDREQYLAFHGHEPPAARAIAGAMGQVLLLTWSGETFQMGSTPIWVQPLVAALMAAEGGL